MVYRPTNYKRFGQVLLGVGLCKRSGHLNVGNIYVYAGFNDSNSSRRIMIVTVADECLNLNLFAQTRDSHCQESDIITRRLPDVHHKKLR